MPLGLIYNSIPYHIIVESIMKDCGKLPRVCYNRLCKSSLRQHNYPDVSFKSSFQNSSSAQRVSRANNKTIENIFYGKTSFSAVVYVLFSMSVNSVCPMPSSIMQLHSYTLLTNQFSSIISISSRNVDCRAYRRTRCRSASLAEDRHSLPSTRGWRTYASRSISAAVC